MDVIALEILDFWFQEIKQEQWFKKDKNFDNLIYNKYFDIHSKAIQGDIEYWKNTSKECLAYIILIDQFSRNLFREHTNSFKYDLIAIKLCITGLSKSYLDDLDKFDEKLFFIMPLIHDENIDHQNLAMKILNSDLKNHPNYEKIYKFFFRHKEIIQLFGRFPHRNKILKRISTKEEIDFLKTPFSSF